MGPMNYGNDVDLFSKGTFDEVLRLQQAAANTAVRKLDKSQLGRDVEAIAADLVPRLQIKPLTLNREAVVLEGPDETEIDVTGYAGYGVSRGTKAKAYRVVFCVPFDGDPVGFHYQPNPFSITDMRGTVVPPPRVLGEPVPGQLKLTRVVAVAVPPDEIKGDAFRMLEVIEENIGRNHSAAVAFNARLPELIRSFVSRRREELSAKDSFGAAFGLPKAN